MPTENKRAEIYSVSYLNASWGYPLTLHDKGIVILNATFTAIKGLQKISYEETADTLGTSTIQKFSASASDTSLENRTLLEKLCAMPIILLITYSNGVKKVLGSKERPIFLAFSNGGNPTAYSLTFQRMDRGSALLYQSFS